MNFDDILKVSSTKELYRPYWSDNGSQDPDARKNPRFLERTKARYARVPLDQFSLRAGASVMVNSLVKYLPEGVVIAGGFVQQVVQDCLLTPAPFITEEGDYWNQEQGDAVAELVRGHRAQKDIDLFFTSEKAFRDTLELLQNPDYTDKEAWMWQRYEIDDEHAKALEEGGSHDMRFVNFLSDNRKPDMQLIKLVWYQDAEHVIDTFDFTCVQFAIEGKDLVMNPLSVFDLDRKRLVLHRMQYPGSTLRRLLKYSQKGFYACPGALADIARQTHEAIQAGVDDGEGFVYLD